MTASRIPKIYLRRLAQNSIYMPLVSGFRGNLKKPCRVWQGATDQKGYGVIRVAPGLVGVPSGLVRVHRLWFWHIHGPYPVLCEVDHQCRAHKACWEEEHLELLGPSEHSIISNMDRWGDVAKRRERIAELSIADLKL